MISFEAGAIIFAEFFAATRKSNHIMIITAYGIIMKRKYMKKIVAETKFAEGLCLKKLFFVFLIGSVIGSLYEEILFLVQHLMATGELAWSLRRGVIWGPFNVIYGFGAVIMVYLLLRKPYKNWQIFIYAALLGGIVEYSISFLQEFFTHTMSWDYSGLWLNINGRTTIPFMLVWGLLGLLLVRGVYPPVSEAIERIPPKIGDAVYVILVVFMALDMLISWTAIIRQTLRHNHIPPYTPIGRFYDEHFTDDYLEHYFPNMRRPEEEE